MANPPGGVDHAYQQHDRADQHYHALHRVVEHAGAKAAIGGIQRDADPEDQQAGIVRNTGSRLQQAGAAINWTVMAPTKATSRLRLASQTSRRL